MANMASSINQNSEKSKQHSMKKRHQSGMWHGGNGIIIISGII